MKRVFIVYAESDEQVKYENGNMIIPANESMALELCDEQYVSKALQLFTESLQSAR